MTADGLNAVIVNPTYMLGPWDWKPSSGRMLLAVGKQFTPMAPPGGNNFADVRDVAAGILLAHEKGEIGRQYILGGENYTYLAAWKLFAKATGRLAAHQQCRAGVAVVRRGRRQLVGQDHGKMSPM